MPPGERRECVDGAVGAGAACHGCLYLAEVSCERMNRMLDRALVVPAIDQPSELALFGRVA